MSIGTLSGNPLSPNVARVLVVSYHLGVKVDFKHVNLLQGEHKKPEFLAINPFGSIPAFVSDDGANLFESRAIAKYIDARGGGKLTHINDAKAYGLVENWGYVEENQFSKFAFILFVELVTKPRFLLLPPDQAAVESNKASLIKSLEVYEKHFATTSFIAGNDLSIADLFHVPLAAQLGLIFPDIYTPFPNVKAWVDRLLALPAWQAVAKEQAEIIAKLTGAK